MHGHSSLCNCMTTHIACNINLCLDLCAAAHDTKLQWQLLCTGNVMCTRFDKSLGFSNSDITSGNHLVKLCMMTAAMRVLPSPVGRQTKVFCSSAVLIMSIWYALSGTEAGYIQCFAWDLQHSHKGSMDSRSLRVTLSTQPQRTPMSTLACCKTYSTALGLQLV